MRPNILIVMTDHQRWDTVLPDGRCMTPNVQRLAGAGVSFTRTYCPAPHCCPARASFHSALYPSRHGVWNNICNAQRLSPGIRAGTRLWSSDLRDAGYDMHFLGKWHVDTRTSPADHGWTEHAVTATGSDVMGLDWAALERLAQSSPPAERPWGCLHYPGYGREMHRNFYAITEEQSAESGDQRKADQASALIHECGGGDQPWAMFVGLSGPHDPYHAPQRWLDRYDLDDVPLPPSYSDTMHDKPNLYRRMREQVFGQWGERETRDAIRHYLAHCSWLDEMFGQMLDALDATGAADDTLVLYCSDHGDYCGDHGLFSKGIPNFDGAYRVPGVIRWPKAVARPGRSIDAMVSLCDFGPTFLEAAGLAVPDGLSGRSLMPWLADDAPDDWRRSLLLQCNGVENYVTQRSIRTADWHYTYNAFDFDELYNLGQDPHETVNLARDPAHRGEVERLCREMWALCHAEEDSPGSSYVTVALSPSGPASIFRDA
ncbi:MAG: sulfatase-like hydrolase/transferase [Planctomycetota bacterium]